MYMAIGTDAETKHKQISRRTTRLLCLSQTLQIDKLKVASSLV